MQPVTLQYTLLRRQKIDQKLPGIVGACVAQPHPPQPPTPRSGGIEHPVCSRVVRTCDFLRKPGFQFAQGHHRLGFSVEVVALEDVREM